MPSIPAVTVIIPVYNVAPYIIRCAESIFGQTLKNLEIIFVDDCSPDNSVELITETLKRFPQRIPHTRILRLQSNHGLAGARKEGLLKAKGEYIIHCDGDDWVDHELYESLYLKALNANADIVLCDEVLEYGSHKILKPTPLYAKTGKEILRNWYKAPMGLYCHNKLVRRNLYFDNNVFPWEDLNMWEDNGLFARLIYHADIIVQITGQPAYHYNRANVNAMTSGYGVKQVNQMIDIAKNLEDFFKSKPEAEDYSQTINAFKYLARINLITNSFTNYIRFLRTFPESKRIVSSLHPDSFSAKGKIRFFMVRYGMGPIFILLFKLKNLLSRF